MFTLRLLGGLRLENGSADPTGRATQRLRLAILALLALAPGRRLTRDRFLSILWPEATADEGRARLSSALYDMRRLLGDRALGSQGDELWLAPALLRVDAEEFLQAVKREAWEEAAELYGGPFLDGVHAGDSAEFEEWVSTHRARLHRAYLGVLERLGSKSMAAGDWDRAEQRWEQLVELEPLNGRWTLELMRAKAALSDRAGAMRTGVSFEARLQQELGIAPDPAVSTFLAELRVAPTQPAASPSPPAAPRSAMDSASPPSGPSSAGRRLATVRSAAWLAAAGLLAVALLALATRDPAPPAGPAAVRIAVFPFAVTGDSGFQFLQDGLVDLLSADLEGVGRFTAVDPHALLALVRESSGAVAHGELARRLGAARFVVGRVFGIGDSVRLQAALHDAATGALLHEARAQGPLDAVPSLVDRLTAQLAAAQFGSPADRIASIAALTTLSIPALREFLAGEAHFRRGRFGAATDAYRRAVTLDTTFALAHYRLSLSILWGNHPGASTSFHDSLALRHADRLSPRDRALVEAYAAWRDGRGDEAYRRYDAIIARHPDDVEAWYQRGETEFHYGPLLGRPIADARVSFERVVALDPSHWGARWHLALLDAKEGRPAGFRARMAELLSLGPDSSSSLEMQLVAGGGREEIPVPRLEQVSHLALFGAGWRRAVFLGDYDGAARLFSMMAGPGRTPYSRVLGRTALGQLELARGRWVDGAGEWADTPAPERFELQVITALLPGFERSAAERDSLERRLHGWVAATSGVLDRRPESAASARLSLALLAAARGDTVTALALARILDTTQVPVESDPLVRGRAGTIRAYVAYRQARYAEALAQLTTAGHAVWYGLAVTSAGKSRSFERFLRAELLRALGRPMEALGWYGGFDEHAIHDLMFLVPALLRSAELNEGIGRSALAMEQLDRAAELWKGADPRYRRMLERQVKPPASSRAR